VTGYVRMLGSCDESLSLHLCWRQRASRQRLRSPAAFSRRRPLGQADAPLWQSDGRARRGPTRAQPRPGHVLASNGRSKALCLQASRGLPLRARPSRHPSTHHRGSGSSRLLRSATKHGRYIVPRVDELLSVKEAAAYLGVGERFVRRLVAEARAPVQHVGRHVRLRRSALDRWLSLQSKPAAAPLPAPKRRRNVPPVGRKGSNAKRSFGTVGRLPSGRWRARYRDLATGRQVTGGTFESKAEAEHWLAAAQVDMARGAWVDPRAGELTLIQWAEQWLAEHTGLRETTRASTGPCSTATSSQHSVARLSAV
jgi:excisionase family DNA binding protein